MKLGSRLWKVIKSIFRWFMRNNELWTLPLAVLLFWFAPGWLAQIDPQAAFFGVDVFQYHIYAIVTVLLFSGLTWLILWVVWPSGRKLMDDIFIHKEIPLWLKVVAGLVLFCSYFWGFLFAVSLLIT